MLESGLQVLHILDSIQLRLGMLRDSDGWIVQRPIVHDFLKSSVVLLDNDFRDQLRFVPNRLLTTKETGSYDEAESVTTFTVPEECDPQRIVDLSVQYSGYWHTIPKGITDQMRNDAYTPQHTYCAWDVIQCGEIEVWPHSTQPWPVRISFYRKPTDYSVESNCIDIDSELLIMLTLEPALEHYGRPNGGNNRRLNRHLGNIKAKQLSGKRFFKRPYTNRAGTPDAADDIYRWPGP